ncbi:NAD-dependent dehydratase (plasmid) [Pantoea cypripedii]|uniref:NAD-dependent dehydratase n=1 Tax=Pantoea cypripedii TaxID=55209 RepID=A0A6B9GFW6_PANCY|nr:NAD(P)-dependent oxidoreductase [Pantoea cypripedii]QGY33187.1 NAD-dependent dehydratase [Pantoea cypripedii]
MMMKNILLTGAAGLIGNQMRERLAQRSMLLRTTDVKAIDKLYPNEEFIQADLGEKSTAEKLVGGIDAILHFGGLSTEADFETICQVNILGAQRLYEAARKAGVKRILFASSVHAIGFYDQTEVIDSRVPVRPDSNYGLSKIFTEGLAQLYWEKYGIETVSVRIGSCEPKPSTLRHLKTWLSFDDMYQLIECSLDATRVGHTIIYGASNNKSSFWDNRHAAHLGYKPKDSADDYAAEIRANNSIPDIDDVASQYQGGIFIGF